MKDNLNQTPRITKKQLDILTLIYEFRFVNNKHIQAKLKQKDEAQARQSIGILFKKGYIGRKRSGKDQMIGAYASYHLLPSGIQALHKKEPKLSAKSLKVIHRDRYASPGFIKRCQVLGDINLELMRLYTEKINFFTKSNMRKYNFLPKPLPDGYIPFPMASDQYKYFFLDLYEDSPLHSIARRKIRQYIQYAESKEWENNTNEPLPTILMIFASTLTQKLLVGYVHRTIIRSELALENVIFMATTLDKLKSATTSDDPIWQRINNDEVSEEYEILISNDRDR
jgi:hypothetical protein